MENPQQCKKGHVDQTELEELIKKEKQPLGSGGQGQVYKMKAKDGCFYAGKTSLKEEDLSLVKESHALSQFVDECGEYVLCFVGFYAIHGYYWVFTEYVQDLKSLFELINDGQRMNAEMVKNLINGLKFLHTKGVAHLDIKPENILINPATNEIRYIDFGLACMSDEKYEPVGTPYYLPPEAFKVADVEYVKNLKMKSDDPNVDPFELVKKLDIWSLGVTIWVSHHGNYMFNIAEAQLYLHKDNWMGFIEYKLTKKSLTKAYLKEVGRTYNIDLNDFINIHPQQRFLRFLGDAESTVKQVG